MQQAIRSTVRSGVGLSQRAAAHPFGVPGQGAARSAPRSIAAAMTDVIALTKPRIALMALITAGGTWLLTAPHLGVFELVRAAAAMVGVGCVVMGAGALNMFLERDVDCLMERTRLRPLPQRRLPAWVALVVGSLLSALAVPALLVGANALTVGIALFSLFLYVLVYTPMKRTSPWSLVVGAVPGAAPALMGATAATGTLEGTGLAMFGVVFLWQLPHFMAINIYREHEYVAAGHKIASGLWGVSTARALMLLTTVPLLVLGVALWPLGVAGPGFAVFATLLGAWFLVVVLRGMGIDPRARALVDAWARKVFFGTLLYQTALFGALALDVVVRRQL